MTESSIMDFPEYFRIYDEYTDKLFSKKKLNIDIQNALHFLRGYIVSILPRNNLPVLNKKNTLKMYARIFSEMVNKTPFLTDTSEIILLSSDPRWDELEIARLLEYPLVKVEYKKEKSFKSFLIAIKSMIYSFYVMYLLKKLPLIKKHEGPFIYEEIMQFYNIYFKTSFGNISTILTENTQYFKCSPIILKANKLNINTVKIDYFVTNAQTSDTTKIYSKYYFPLDKVHREFYSQFDYNKDVIYIEPGGRLNSDGLAEIVNVPTIPKKKKIITYLSAHGYLFSDLDIFYLDKFKEFLNKNNDYVLVIKTHPNDNREFENYVGKNIKISKVTGHKYFKLACQSDFVMTVFSSLLYQTKLINDNVYALDFYNAEGMQTYHIDEGQNAYSKYLEVIKSENELYEILLGNKTTTSRKFFIKELNPNFGHVADKFKEEIVKLGMK